MEHNAVRRIRGRRKPASSPERFGKRTSRSCGRHERTGRPLGDAKFLAMLEQKRDRILALQKPGPKPRAEAIAKRRWPAPAEARN